METTEELAKPLRWPWAVTRLVCSQCGDISEIDIETANTLISVMEILNNRPEIKLENRADYKNYYFESNYCKYCTTKEIIVKLKQIEP